MKSAGNRGVVQIRLQVLHVHVFLVAAMGNATENETGSKKPPIPPAINVHTTAKTIIFILLLPYTKIFIDTSQVLLAKLH